MSGIGVAGPTAVDWLDGDEAAGAIVNQFVGSIPDWIERMNRVGRWRNRFIAAQAHHRGWLGRNSVDLATYLRAVRGDLEFTKEACFAGLVGTVVGGA